MELTEMSDEELQQVALMKNRKGCATSKALRAQRILLQRHNSFLIVVVRKISQTVVTWHEV